MSVPMVTRWVLGASVMLAVNGLGLLRASLAAAEPPTALVPGGVTNFALAAPKIFWHTAAECPLPPPGAQVYGPVAAADDESGSGAAAEDPEVITRIATYGSAARQLFFSNAPRPPDVCNPYKFYSPNIVADDSSVYWVDATGLVRLSTNANVGDPPQLLSGAINGKDGRYPAELAIDLNHVLAITYDRDGNSIVWQVNKSDGSPAVLAVTTRMALNLTTDGDFVYWVEVPGRDLRRFSPADSSVITIASAVTGYYAAGLRFGCVGFECFRNQSVYIAQFAQVIVYDNLDGSTSRPVYVSSDPAAEIYALTHDGDSLFVFEDRPIPCFPEPCFPDHNNVLIRQTRGVVSALYLHNVGFVGGSRSAHLLADPNFLFWQESGALLRLAKDASALPMTNMRVTGIEVPQSVQDNNNNVLLVQDRRTFVRVYVQSDGPPVAGVTALLFGAYADGTQRVGPLEPVNPVGKNLTVSPSPKRDNLNDSFLFELPWDWTEHTDLTLHAELNPYKVPLQASYANNTMDAGPFRFEPSPRLAVQFVAFGYTLNNTTYYPRFIQDILANYSWIRRVYPLASRPGFFGDPGPGLRTSLWFVFDEGLGARVAQTAKECKDNLCASAYANAKLDALRKENNIADSIFMYGMISDGAAFPRGQACCGTNVSTGPAGDKWIGFYAGHEIGHTLGRGHPRTGNGECELSGSDADPAYPHAHIGPDDGSVAGFDVGDPDRAFRLPVKVLPGKSWYDVMAYCQPAWISDTNYENLYNYMIAHPPPAGDAAAGSVVAGDFLNVIGQIDSARGTAVFLHLSRLSSVASVPPPQPGDYSIQLLNAQGGTVADYPFTPRVSEDGDASTLNFSEVISFVAGTAQVRVVRRSTGQVLVTQRVSANPPTVGGVALQGASSPVTGVVTLTWNASDADGDFLHFDVLYSRDGGASLQPLAMGLADTSVEIDTARLGGGTALIRVVATDGVNTAQADSPSLTLAGKAPQPRILLPADGTRVHFGQLVNFSGEVEDFQDGGVNGQGLVWTAGDRTLGRGALLSVTDLPVGPNQVTLTAANTLGLSASTTITVIVDDDLTLPGPTLSVAPSEIAWSVAAGSTQLQSAQVTISNSGGGDLRWTASTDAPWLLVNPTEGSAPAVVTVTAGPAGFAAGTQPHANVLVSAPDVPGQAVTIPVTLTIGNLYAGPPVQAPVCVGDCNSSNEVTVDELLIMVNIALENLTVSSCSVGDASGDGQITIDEILTAVNNALTGCGQ